MQSNDMTDVSLLRLLFAATSKPLVCPFVGLCGGDHFIRRIYLARSG